MRRWSYGLGLITTALLACGADATTMQVLPDCATCTAGAPRGGIFVDTADLRPDVLTVSSATLAAIARDAEAARFLARVDGELGVAELPPFELPGTDFWIADAIPDTDGGWYLLGNADLAAGSAVTYLFAFDRNGVERWHHDFGVAFPHLALFADGTGVIVRRLEQTYQLLAFTADGTLRFERRLEAPFHDIRVLDSGEIVVIGAFSATFDAGGGLPLIETEANSAIFILGLGPDGATRWVRLVEPGRATDFLGHTAAAISGDGRVFLAGNANGFAIAIGDDTLPITAVGPDGLASFVLEIAPDGRLAWGVTAGSHQPTFWSLAPLADGVVAAGSIDIGPGRGAPFNFAGTGYVETRSSDAVIMELGGGRVRWQHTIAGAASQVAFRVAAAPSGALFAAVGSERRDDDTEDATIDDTALRGDGVLIVELGR